MRSTYPFFPNFFVLLLAKFVFVSPTVRPESIFPEMWALVGYGFDAVIALCRKAASGKKLMRRGEVVSLLHFLRTNGYFMKYRTIAFFTYMKQAVYALTT